MDKIGLFFGSFNPIHVGHLIIANIILETTDLKEVWFVVSPQNPLKKSSSLAHEFDRLYMVERAIFGNYRMKACDIEFHMPKPSYTIDTLTWLKEKHSDKDFVLLMGQDNLETFHKWKNYETILEHYSIYVYPRPGSTSFPFSDHRNIKKVFAPLLEISATFIRDLIRNNKSVQYLLCPEVEGYIKNKGLFL